MRKRKLISAVCAVAMLTVSLAGCGTKSDTKTETETTTKTESRTLNVAALEGGYGVDAWKQVTAEFEKINPGVTVKLTIDKKIEDIISPDMKAGNYPDVIHCGVGRQLALTETLIKEKGITDITDVLDMTVPGESVKVKDKIIPGFTETLATNPYGDGKTYLAPMFYGPCGLFYDANLLKTKGWEVPKTWDEMWELGEKAKAEGIALFTYPTTGYFDAFMYALLSSIGGSDFYNKCMSYEPGIWMTAEATQAFDIVGKLAQYTEATTVANANDDNYTKNQQLILDHKAIFIPNGTWLPGEMKDAPRADGFQWGFTALPAVKDGGAGASFTFFEQLWLPAEASKDNKDLAKQFVAFMYSDTAVQIFAKAGAVQPVEGVSQYLEGDNKLYYSIYDNGATAVMGGLAATEPVEGVNMTDTLFGTVNSIVSGDKTVADWQKAVTEASDKLAAAK